MTETGSSRAPKKKKAILIALALAALVIAAVGYKYYLDQRISPVTSLHDVHLGMREVDATLAYGRNPDCDGAEDDLIKEIVFHGRSRCSTSLTFKKEGGTTRLIKICSNDGLIPAYIENFRKDYYETDESAIIRNFGRPSHVSISEDGTGKLVSFARFNVAFALRRGSAQVYCITEDLPLVFKREYQGAATEG